MRTHLRLAACLATLLASSTPALAERASDPLAPVVQCLRAGKFGVLEQRRLPATANSRTVETDAGTKTVSTTDGYRVILATPQGLPFVNVKVEQSTAAAAAADREAVEAQMLALASHRAPDQQDLTRTTLAGVDMLALHQPNLERGGPISFYSFFVSSRALIATAYVLNQEPARRAYSTYAEYEVLRDDAAQLVQACIMPGNT